MANINIRTEESVKRQAEAVFDELGLPMSVAINVFLKQAIRERGIPFEVKIDTPNEVTMNALVEAEKLAKDKNAKRYKDTDDLRRTLGI